MAAPTRFQGDIAEQPLAELLQYLQGMRKVGQLFLEKSDPPMSAAIYFTPGRVVHAHCPPLEGTIALLAILSWTSGRFLFLADAAPDRETITGDLNAVLLESMRRQDEMEVLLKRLPPARSLLFPERDRSILVQVQLSWREWRMLSSVDGVRDVAALIALEPGAELENAQALDNLARHGLVRTVPRGEFLTAVVLATILRRDEIEQLACITLLDLDVFACCDGRTPLGAIVIKLGVNSDAIAESARRLVDNDTVKVVSGLQAWHRWLR